MYLLASACMLMASVVQILTNLQILMASPGMVVHAYKTASIFSGTRCF